MHLCFIDESGTAAKPDTSTPRYFVVGGLIIPEERWGGVREKLIGLKRRQKYRGELKWRFFAPSNNDKDNPMLSWSLADKDKFRDEVFSIITSTRSLVCLACVCDAPLAYALSNINEQEDVYFGTYKPVTERFQYFLQDTERYGGRSTFGIIVSDHRNGPEDNRMRKQHEKLVRSSAHYTSTYKNFIEGIFLSPSHMSVGVQLVDMVAGATYRAFANNDRRYINKILPSFRKSPAGKVDGFGIARFPKSGWTGPII